MAMGLMAAPVIQPKPSPLISGAASQCQSSVWVNESMAQIPLAPCSRHLLAVATVSGQLPGSLQDNGNIHMLLGVVQHGKQCVLCIGYQLIIWAPRSTSFAMAWASFRYGPRNVTTAFRLQRFSVSRSHTVQAVGIAHFSQLIRESGSRCPCGVPG